MRKILIGFIVTIFIGMVSAAAQGQTDPSAVVANLYRQGRTRKVARMSQAELLRFFDSRLAGLIRKAATGDGGIDFDILYDAQDTKISNLKIDPTDTESATSRSVHVTFTNFGEKKEIYFRFAPGKAGWKITEIYYDEGRLSAMLKAN